MWRAYVIASNLTPGAGLYARSPDRSMRFLADVGDRRLYGGLIADAYGPGGYRWSHGFDMDDDEQLVVVLPLQKKRPDFPLIDAPNFEAIIADREHAAL